MKEKKIGYSYFGVLIVLFIIGLYFARNIALWHLKVNPIETWAGLILILSVAFEANFGLIWYKIIYKYLENR